MNRYVSSILLCLLLSGTVLRGQDADGPGSPDDVPAQPTREYILTAFKKHVALSTLLTDDGRSAITDSLATSEAGPPDRQLLRDPLGEALSAAVPALAKAAILLQKENPRAAQESLAPLLGHGDPYIRAHARYLQAKALLALEDAESAAPILAELAGPSRALTLHQEEVVFLEALSHLLQLDRDAATAAFTTYLDTYATPRQPGRRKAARNALRRLKQYKKDTLPEATELMDYSRRRLTLEDPGQTTQTRQRQIVMIMDDVITKEEERRKKQQQQQQQSASQGESQGQAPGPAQGTQSSNPAESSQVSAGAGQMGALGHVNRGDARNTWGRMKDHERDEVLNVIKGRFPARYEEILSQYFRSLQDEELDE